MHNSSATIDELLSLANNIFTEIKKSTTEKDKLFNELHLKYRDFAQSFPIVLRWMVYVQDYDVKTFKRYLIKIKSPSWSTRKDFLESQADYLTMLYFTRNPCCSKQKLSLYRQAMINQLLEEDKQFEEAYKEAEIKEEQSRKESDLARRQRIYNFLGLRDNSNPK
jgi:hypothetical protein